MAAITGSADNIYASYALVEVIRGPLQKFISRVDADSERIQRADAHFKFKPFQESSIPDQYDQYIESHHPVNHKWNAELFGVSRADMKVACLQELIKDCRDVWEDLQQKISTSKNQNLSLAFVEGEINITVITKRERISADLTHTFKVNFCIYQLQYPVILSDLSSDQLKRVQAKMDGLVSEVRKDIESIDDLLDHQRATAKKAGLVSILV